MTARQKEVLRKLADDVFSSLTVEEETALRAALERVAALEQEVQMWEKHWERYGPGPLGGGLFP